MNIRHLVVPQDAEFLHRLLVNAGRALLVAALVILVVTALFAFLSETASVEETASAENTSRAVSAAVSATYKFEYFPDLYQNQAKQIEEPIATF